MKKFIDILFIPIFFYYLLLSFSCNSSPMSYNDDKSQKDTIIREIPAYMRTPSYIKHKNDLEKILGINSLENGGPQIEIRILRDYPLSDTSYLLVLTKESEWSGRIYRIKYNFVDGQLTSTEKKIIPISPKSGWSNFINELTNLDIFNLPDYSDIKGYLFGTSTDPDAVSIETFTNKKYRSYQYFDPHDNQDNFIQANKIVQILKLVDNEFDVKMEKF